MKRSSSRLRKSARKNANSTLENEIANLPDDIPEEYDMDAIGTSKLDDVDDENNEAETSGNRTVRFNDGPVSRPRSAFTHLGVFQEDVGTDIRLDIDEATGEFITQTVQELGSSDGDHEPEPMPKRRGRPNRMQSRTMDALLGQATVHAARCQYEEAMQLLREVVRQEPRRPNAYRQISEIYEMQNDLTRSFEFNLLACHVDRSATAYDWDQVGDMALKLSKMSAALACYQKAAKLASDKWIYYAKRLKLLEDTGAPALLSMRTKLYAIESVNVEESKLSFDWFHGMMLDVMQYFKNTYDTDRYLKALTYYVVRCFLRGLPYLQAFEELASILCEKQMYPQLLNLILGIFEKDVMAYKENDEPAYEVKFSQAMVTVYPTPTAPRVHKFYVGDEISTLLLARLILAMVKTESSNCAKSLFNVLIFRPYDPEIENYYFDIGIAVQHSGDFSDGLYYAQLLTQSAVLSRNANSWYLLGFYTERCVGEEQALESYYHCLKLDHSHVDARISISSILEAMEKPDEALDILKDYNLDGCYRLPDERILIRQARVFANQGKNIERLRTLRMILLPHFHTVHAKLDKIMKQRRTQNNRVVHVILRRAIMASLSRTPLEKLVNRLGTIAERDKRPLSNMTSNELHALTMDLVNGLARQKQYQELLPIICYAFLHPNMPSVQLDTLQNILFYASIKAENFLLAFEYLRYNHNLTLNLNIDETAKAERLKKVYLAMNFVFCHQQTISFQRFIHRSVIKAPNNVRLRIIAGNNCLTSGSYKNALFEYSTALKEVPNDPLLHLQIALCFTHLACRRDITNRTALAHRAMAYMGKYKVLRLKTGTAQEIYYNIGKMFHQLAIHNTAVYWYNRVLEEPTPRIVVEDERTGDGQLVEYPIYDLKRLAAHNICVMLGDCNPAYSRMLKAKYCVLK